MKPLEYVLAAISFALLAACGGGSGGGGSGTPVVPPTLNLKTAWEAYYRQNATSNYVISGILSNTDLGGSGTYINAYTASTSVPVYDPNNPYLGKGVILSNMSKSSEVFNFTLVANGSSFINSSTVDSYYDSNGVLKVINDLDADEQSYVTSFTDFPTSVTSGSGGNVYTATVYSRLGYTCGTENKTYSVTAESNTALIVTFTKSQNTTNKALGECTTQTQIYSDVYRLTAGGIRYVTSTASGSGVPGSVTLTFQ